MKVIKRSEELLPEQGSVEEFDKKYGFQDWIFETSKNHCEGIRLIKGVGDNIYWYEVKREVFIGKFKTESVSLGFYKGKLYIINIEMKGIVNCNGVLNVFQLGYGKGEKENIASLESIFWRGQKILGIFQFTSTSEASMTIQSLIIENQIKKEGEASISALKDL